MRSEIPILEGRTVSICGGPWLGAAKTVLRTAALLGVTATLSLVALVASVTGPASASTLEPVEKDSGEGGTEERSSLTGAGTQTYEIYVNAPAEKVWEAITSSQWTTKYGYQGRVEYELQPGGSYRAYSTEGMVAMGVPEVAIDGEVLEAKPPHRLVQTYRFLFNDVTKAEGFTKLVWEIEDTGAGFSRLAVTHEVGGAPIMAGMVSKKDSPTGPGGWGWILSDMKSVLETGKRLGQ